MVNEIISADDHIDLCYCPADLWQSRVPARFRAAAPRVVETPGRPKMWIREDKEWGIYGSKRQDGRKVIYDEIGLAEEAEPGVWRATTAKYRLEDMDRENIQAQILYNFLYHWNFVDKELQQVCLEAFNTWLVEELCAPAPNRLVGLAALPGHDVAAAVGELQRIARLGLRGAIFDVFGALIPIHDEAWAPLWALAEEVDMPISVHIGAGLTSLAKVPRHLPWRASAVASVMCMQLDEVLVALLMSGMLERHPRLKIVLGESSLGWIPFVLERLEYEFDNYDNSTRSTSLRIRPKDLFKRQIYATFQDEDLGVRLIPEIGEDNVMWASDYPHADGTFPHSDQVIRRLIEKMPPELAHKAMGATAKALYRLT
jgi:predicted TIM-barrel fold metal-dependent hydrolase